MKKYFILIGLFVIFLFSGCKQQPTINNQIKLPKNIELNTTLPVSIQKNEKNKNIITFTTQSANIYLKFAKTHLKELKAKKEENTPMYIFMIKDSINTIKAYGKIKNAKYFAIVNPKFNNLSGYPINTQELLIAQFKMFFTPHFFPTFHFLNDGILFKNGIITINVVYFKKKLPGLFLWKI